MIAYKLFTERKDGTLGPLFINRRQRVPIGKWVEAECHPTKGYAVRPGWHCTSKPTAPHLKLKDDRVWVKVEIDDSEELHRPDNQGGLWFIANKMRVIEKM